MGCQPITQFPKKNLNQFSFIDCVKSASRSIKFSTRPFLFPCVEVSHVGRMIILSLYIYISTEGDFVPLTNRHGNRSSIRTIVGEAIEINPPYRLFRKIRIDFPVRIGSRARPGYLCRSSTMENGYNPVLYANMRSTCVYRLMQ